MTGSWGRRRVARLPRRASTCKRRQGGRGDARGAPERRVARVAPAGALGREGGEAARGARLRDLDGRRHALVAPRPPRRALHRAGRARRGHPAGPRPARAGPRGRGDAAARPRGEDRARHRQRRDDAAPREGGRGASTSASGHGAPQEDVKKAATMDLELESRTTKRVAEAVRGGHMTAVCRDGHLSDEPDYCSVCGAPILAAPAAAGVRAAPPAAAGSTRGLRRRRRRLPRPAASRARIRTRASARCAATTSRRGARPAPGRPRRRAARPRRRAGALPPWSRRRPSPRPSPRPLPAWRGSSSSPSTPRSTPSPIPDSPCPADRPAIVFPVDKPDMLVGRHDDDPHDPPGDLAPRSGRLAPPRQVRARARRRHRPAGPRVDQRHAGQRRGRAAGHARAASGGRRGDARPLDADHLAGPAVSAAPTLRAARERPATIASQAAATGGFDLAATCATRPRRRGSRRFSYAVVGALARSSSCSARACSSAPVTAMKTVGKDTAPSIIAAQEISYALADLDANAGNYLLGNAGPPGRGERRPSSSGASSVTASLLSTPRATSPTATPRRCPINTLFDEPGPLPRARTRDALPQGQRATPPARSSSTAPPPI